MADDVISMEFPAGPKMVEGQREFVTEWPVKRNDEFHPKRKRLRQTGKLDLKGYPGSSVRASQDKSDGVAATEGPSRAGSYQGRHMYWSSASCNQATAALAKWWRRKLQSHGDQGMYKIPKSDNPNTVLKYVGSLPEAKAFMKQQVHEFKQQIVLNPSCAKLHSALGSYYDRLQNYCQAIHHLSLAVELDPSNKETRWLLTKVKRDKDLQYKTKSIEDTFKVSKCPDKILHLPEPIEVERCHYSSLSVQEFYTKYCLTNTPVIITGIVEHMTRKPWSLEHIKKTIGQKKASLRRTVKESAEWAKLEPAEPMTVAEFINTLHSQSEPSYLFDWSLPIYAPALARELMIPKYFAGDFLQRTTPGSLYRESWPSLFIAPAGLHSDLHVDGFGSNFWMALFQGRKRWTFFSKGDTPMLYPHYEQSLDLVFDVDLSSPDFEKHPLLSETSPRQCVLQPGELLFVPHGSPHRVENLEDSLAISSNFVDLSNYHAVLEELRCSALVDPRADDLVDQLLNSDFPSKMYSQQEDLAWDEFKKWPRDDYTHYDIDIKDIRKEF